MTLDQWCKATGVRPTAPTTERGAVSLWYGENPFPSYHAQLWKLDDYAVSSRSGPVVWLVPRMEHDRDGGHECQCAECFAKRHALRPAPGRKRQWWTERGGE